MSHPHPCFSDGTIATLIAECIRQPDYRFIIDPVEPWFNVNAIEGFTGISQRTLQNKKVPRHPVHPGFYRMSALTPNAND